MSFDIVRGSISKPQQTRELISGISEYFNNSGDKGTLYLGYPLTANSDSKVTIDALMVSEKRGMVAFVFGNHSSSADELKDDQDALYYHLDFYLKKYGGGGEKSFVVTSNATWSMEVVDENNEDVDWVHVPNGEVTGTATITVTADANTQKAIRCAILKIKSGELEEKINIVQYDVFSEKFVQLNIDNSISLKSSSDYNHDLATWAMELSFAAYNYPDDRALPMIPGLFMNDYSAKVTDLLQGNGFNDMIQYNYSDNDAVAHTIGHRTIVVNNTNNTNIQMEAIQNDNLGNNSIDINDYNGHSENGILLYDTASAWNDSGSTITEKFGTTVAGVGTTGTNNRTYIGNPLSNSVTQNSNSNERALITIVVRGSVTGEDWWLNINTQFNAQKESFETGRDMVLNSLYHGTGDTENCLECNGDGCEICMGYITYHDLSDPIFLVTGHSLGAAVANLTAGHINVCANHSACGNNADVYAYTFATPHSVNGNIEDNSINNNIFNILNNNDVVPLVPLDLMSNDSWSRYGRDYHITMPMVLDILPILDTALLGLGGHAMPNYLIWLNNLPGILDKSPEQITNDDLSNLSNSEDPRGLLPRFLSISCPVSVSIYDDFGNLLAYESQNPNAEYLQSTNSEIVSWISEDGTKMFFIPCEYDSIDVHVEAYDYGTMSLTVETIGMGEPVSVKTFNDVILHPGKEFLVEVSEDVLPEDTQLYITENGEIVGEVTETDPPLKGVTVNHEEKTDRVVTYLTFVTDNTVSEIRFYKIGGNSTSYIFPTSSHATVVEDGDNLIWTAGYVYNTAGDYSYDVSVKSGEEWHYYENVFAVHIPQEYIDIKNGTLETNSIQTMSEDLGAEMTPFSSIDDI